MTVNRNDPCPCGSGRKYKKCCMSRTGAGDGSRTGAGGDTRAAAGAIAGGGPNAAGSSAAVRELLATAWAHQRAGRLEPARQHFRQVLGREPENAEALWGLGKSVGDLGHLARSIQLLRRATALDPSRPEYHASLGVRLHQAGDEAAALRAAERAVALDPGQVLAHTLIADLHERANRLDDALAAVRVAIDLAPDDTNAGILLSRILVRRGDLDDARRRLDAITAREQDPIQLMTAHKLLAHVLDKQEEYAAAFAALERAGEAGLAAPPAKLIDSDAVRRRIARSRAGWTADRLARFGAERFDDDRPRLAFLVGFPRSGTTMTEQVLAAHDDVVTTDEQPLLHAVREELARTRAGEDATDLDSAAALAGADRTVLLHLRDVYWRDVATRIPEATAGRVLVDKLPMNIIDLGLINAVFPDARVITALRDPRDVCVSCFMQTFEFNMSMVNFLTWAGTARFYAESMASWLEIRDRLTMPFIEVRYEDTVADLETQARRILAFLGVAWDEGVIRFHEKAKDRTIRTASYSAVAQPLYTKAVARWRNYEPQIARVRDLLAPFVKAFGYGEDEGEPAS